MVDTADTVVGRLIEHYLADRHDGRREAATPIKGRQRSKARPQRRRARKGERTPTEDFFEPLLSVLKDADGQLPASDAIDRVGQLMGERLNEVDRARLPSGEVRWRNGVRWARQRLEEQGKLDGKAAYGVWKLAEPVSGS